MRVKENDIRIRKKGTVAGRRVPLTYLGETTIVSEVLALLRKVCGLADLLRGRLVHDVLVLLDQLYTWLGEIGRLTLGGHVVIEGWLVRCLFHILF